MVPKLANDNSSVTLDIGRFKDRNYWYSINARNFLVRGSDLQDDLSSFNYLLEVKVTGDIIIMLLYSYNSSAVYKASIEMSNKFNPFTII